MSQSRHLALWILISIFFIGLWLTSLLILLIGTETRFQLLTGACLQDVITFIAPALACGWLLTHKPLDWIGINKKTRIATLVLTALTYIASIALLNYIVTANEGLSLPENFHRIEQIMRTLEDRAAATTQILLSDSSFAGLTSGILVIGIIGPVAEEIFFRGALQNSLYGPHKWKAVWWTALIFSLLHFQMYGFLPRFLLGLWFGYLYLWSSSLWPSILAHVLNNSATVVCQWLVARGQLSESVINIGADGNVWIILISTFLTITFIYITDKTVVKRQKFYDSKSVQTDFK